MTKGKAIFTVTLLLVFATGFICGLYTAPRFMMGRAARHDRMPPGNNGPRDNDRDRSKTRDFIVLKLAQELDLNDEQTERVKELFKNGEAGFAADQAEIRKILDRNRKKLDSQIMDVLDDKQKEKFRKIISQVDKDGMGMIPGDRMGPGPKGDPGSPGMKRGEPDTDRENGPGENGWPEE